MCVRASGRAREPLKSGPVGLSIGVHTPIRARVCAHARREQGQGRGAGGQRTSGTGTHAWQACRRKSAPGLTSLNLHRRPAPRNRPTGIPTHAMRSAERGACVRQGAALAFSPAPRTPPSTAHYGTTSCPSGRRGLPLPPPPRGSSSGGSLLALHALPSRLLWFDEASRSTHGQRRPQTACSVAPCACRCARVLPLCKGAAHLPKVGHDSLLCYPAFR